MRLFRSDSYYGVVSASVVFYRRMVVLDSVWLKIRDMARTRSTKQSPTHFLQAIQYHHPWCGVRVAPHDNIGTLVTYFIEEGTHVCSK